MTLAEDLKQLNIDMKYGGKGYEAYYRIGLSMPFLFEISGDKIGNLQYLRDIKDLNNIDPIQDSVAINKISGVLKDYIDLTTINDLYNIDWIEGLVLILESNGYINETPISFFIKTPSIFTKYCEFILGRENYGFSPTEGQKAFAKDLALHYSREEMNLVLGL